MSLGEHFREFRNRLIIAALAVLACSIVGWVYYVPLIGFISEPVTSLRNADGDPLVPLNFATTLTAPFSLRLRVSIFVGIVLSAPVWLWQIWAFLLPGLTRKEKRLAFYFGLASVPLFFAGALLAAWALPRTIAVLLSFAPPDSQNLQDATVYLNFVLYFILAFGIAFLLPVFMVGLNSVGLFPVHAMRSGWRISLLLILIFSAMATPDPSAWTLFALATPMYGLYWAAVLVASLNERRRKKRDPDWLATADDEASAL
jgi:sec-independent protein translocase protein TatC